MTESPREAILAQERRALDHYSSGRPSGYLEVQADDVTYFDDIAAHDLVRGIDQMRDYWGQLDAEIPAHEYEMVDPHVQLYGDVGILTLHYLPTMPDGTPGPPWKATSVYRRQGDEWRIVHAHWSMIKSDVAEGQPQEGAAG